MRLSTLLTLVMLSLSCQSQAAPIVDGKFESGDFSGWSVLGPHGIHSFAAVVDGAFPLAPLQGDYSALLVAPGEGNDCFDPWAIGCDPYPPIPFQNSPPSGPTLSNPHSIFLVPGPVAALIPVWIIGRDFDAQAGDLVALTWRFLSNEGVSICAEPPFYMDDAFIFLTNGSTSFFTLFTDGNCVDSQAPVGTGFESATLPATVLLTIPDQGVWTIYVGVAHGSGDTLISSGVLVDDVRQLREVVPEPATLALLGLGLAGLGVSRRKQ